MKEAIQKYKTAKIKSKQYMQKGEISAYFNSLLEVNQHKKVLVAMASN
jgi:hypothetical protein